MLSKTLWAICGVLLIVLLGIFYRSENKSNSQKILGTQKSIQPVKLALTKPPQKNSNANDLQIYAKSYILMDVDSSYVLASKEPNLQVPIASTTKIMTATLVLEDFNDKLNDIVEITYPMIAIEGSDISLRVGEKITVDNLLKGLLIKSGNDTAFALATYFGGKDKFVEMMNKKSSLIGLKNTQFKDPAGLDDSGYSTAYDLAILSSYAMKIKQFRELVRIPDISFSSTDGKIIHNLENSNRLIRLEEQYYYPFAIGIKTGFTPAAGHGLVAQAEKDNHKIISVILNTNEDTIVASAKESKKLLEWGFNNWTWK
ncbi:MAG: Serine-type D-Ala-D-Ala carboxypeptidase [Berkelbacteria bacterium GW2011_GWB1_38_5]|uniref:Serine-type D-Ala-D-Ala carboxypeptidase n=2 Tax=Candidatus Berkelbacteria TaxID=1618330 RepID=A0A0G0LGC3_9BACT|nr:MAG: Serine-type D-Ala-D-Ala carboxypeptidase [Berkelbacteria bacterium GW2011_GWB1_38_5]KKQ90938.1 MAG: Serine-type D-Ala-D-Ala carboxypeptidase [Berkelbacteria bacterium GW2011_GWA1_39_10]